MTALPSVLPPEELAPVLAGDSGVMRRLDEAAAAMLAQLLEKHGIGARVVPSEAVSVANLPRLDVTGVQMACLHLPGTQQLYQRPLPRTSVTSPASAGEDRRRVLDVDGAGGRGAGCARGHARRSRRHFATASGGTGRKCGKGGRERRSRG